MKINHLNLTRYLSQAQYNVYWISSDEDLLRLETADLIRNFFCHKLNYERLIYVGDQNCQWQELPELFTTDALFDTGRLIDLFIPAIGKIKKKEAQILKSYSLNKTTVFLITTPSLKKADLSKDWVKHLIENSYHIPIANIPSSKVPAWVKQRAAQMSLELSDEAIKLLHVSYEKNLLNLNQELQKLKIMFPQQRIDSSLVIKVIRGNSNYSVFELMDDAIAGRSQRCMRMLHFMQLNTTAPPELLLWALGKELRVLYRLCSTDSNQSRGSILREMRVFSSRHAIMLQAVQRLNTKKVIRMMQDCREIDQINKGVLQSDNLWDRLITVFMRLSGLRI